MVRVRDRVRDRDRDRVRVRVRVRVRHGVVVFKIVLGLLKDSKVVTP